MTEEKKDLIKKHYEAIQEKLNLIPESDKRLFQRTFDRLHSKIKSADVERFVKKPLDNYQYIESIFDRVAYEDIIKCIGPLLIAIGSFKAYQHFTKPVTDAEKAENPDAILIFQLIGLSIVISILMTVVETFYINEDINLKDSTFYRLAQEAKENWKRYWSKFKAGEYKDLVFDMLKSTIIMFWKGLKWQLEIARKDTGYAVLFSANWITNAAILYLSAKFIGKKTITWLTGKETL